jgi:iron complex transport system substrate-binding protein
MFPGALCRVFSFMYSNNPLILSAPVGSQLKTLWSAKRMTIAKQLQRIELVIFISFFCILSIRAEIITDDKGRKIDIKLPVESIVSLSPAHTEIVYALGGGDKLRAVSVNCDYPLAALAKEKAGSFMSPDIEKIVKLNPDVVLATGELQDKCINALADLGVKVVVFSPHDVLGIEKDIQTAGRLLGEEKNAERIAAHIDKISFGLKKFEPVKVYMEVWGNPALGIGRESFLTDVISKAGGISILGDSLSSYPKVSPEEIIKRDPDVILLLYTPEAGYMKRKYFAQTKAGLSGNIFVIEEKDMNVMLRPGPRVSEAIELVKNIIEKSKNNSARVGR